MFFHIRQQLKINNERNTNKFLFLLLLVGHLLFVACTAGQDRVDENFQYLSYCTIYNYQGQPLWTFNGDRCVFFENGEFIVGTPHHLTKYSSSMKELWRKPIRTHHLLHTNRNKDQVLVMSSEYKLYKNKKVRFDLLLVIDLNGNILKRFSFYKHRKDFLQRVPGHKVGKKVQASKVEWEFSHANSFYEIDKNKLSSKYASFAQGNYLINANLLNLIFVIDPAMTKILWSMSHTETELGEPNIHDVQMQKSGRLILFANRGEKNLYSTIDEIDPIAKNREIIYKATPPESYYVKWEGSVKRLSEKELLISQARTQEIKPGGRIVHLASGKVRFWPEQLSPFALKASTNGPVIYPINLTAFLKNNQGL